MPYEAVADTGFLRGLMSWLLPALLFFALWSFVVKRAMDKGGAGFLSIGKSRARVYVETDTKVTFKDIAGVDEAKEELQEIIRFLMDPKQYGRLGAHIPKGVLLVGPPGTGKTLLARAVAGEAGVPFFSISGAEFVEMFVGVGAARVRDLFEQARSRAPAIIFIDELDALGRARGSYGLGGHDEKEQTLNQLLAEMDGFDTSSGLVMLAATNRPEILDPAEELATYQEGCLSVPGMRGVVARHSLLRYRGCDLDGRPLDRTVSGFHARVVQHEVDHLDGILFIDHISSLKRNMILRKLLKARKEKERDEAEGQAPTKDQVNDPEHAL